MATFEVYVKIVKWVKVGQLIPTINAFSQSRKGEMYVF